MKTGTTGLLKFKKLRRRLQLSLWETVGVLEALWQVAFSNAPCGDIGKLSNEDIAAEMEWSGDADSLIEALVETGWLDADHEFRLIVHDWSDHVPNFVKGNVQKYEKQFADVVAKNRHDNTPQGSVQIGASPGEPPQGTIPPNQSNQTKQNPTKPTKPKGSVGVGFYKNSITAADLKDTAKVLAYVKTSAPEADKLRVLAAAERALEVADNPGGMFLTIVKEAKWGLASEAQEDRAAARLKAWQSRAGPPTSAGKNLAAALSPPTE